MQINKAKVAKISVVGVGVLTGVIGLSTVFVKGNAHAQAVDGNPSVVMATEKVDILIRKEDSIQAQIAVAEEERKKAIEKVAATVDKSDEYKPLLVACMGFVAAGFGLRSLDKTKPQ